MKCPDCDVELVQDERDGIDMEICPSCKGMWLTCQELAQLEDEVFDFGDEEKRELDACLDAYDPQVPPMRQAHEIV
jgi:Zn-finger nucleic acid-binding protein